MNGICETAMHGALPEVSQFRVFTMEKKQEQATHMRCSCFVFLTTKAEFRNQRTVLGDVPALEVLKQAFPFCNHHDEAATGSVVLLKFVEMLGKAFDTEGKKCDLTFY